MRDQTGREHVLAAITEAEQELADLETRCGLASFLELDAKAIGQIRGGKRAPNRRLDVAILQSVIHEGRVDDVVASYGHVIVDECHHVPAVTFERAVSEVRARHVLGLTATAKRRDGHHPILLMQLGPVRFSADPHRSRGESTFSRRVFFRETTFVPTELRADVGIQELYAVLAKGKKRATVPTNGMGQWQLGS